jgi:hypothetical protein
MGTFEIILSMLIPIGVSIALFYIIKKQREGISEGILSSSVKKKHATKPEVKDLVFASNEEREKYILEISKMHETNIITWFESDLKYLNDLFGTDNPGVQNYLYSSISAYEINPDIPMVLWGCHPLASIEKEILPLFPHTKQIFALCPCVSNR